MNRLGNLFKPLMWFMALVLAAFVAGCGGGGGVGSGLTFGGGGGGGAGGGVGGLGLGPAPVNLGTAGNYAIFANTGIDSATSSGVVVTGDMGAGPGVTATAITGFALNLPAGSAFSTSAQVTGNVYAFDYAPPTPTEVTTASTDMGTAYTDAAGRTAGVGPFLNRGGGTLTDLTLVAGVYTWGTNVTIPTDLTLSGGANDVWIFQITGTLDMAAAKSVILIGGALPQNIFWQVADVVSIGTTTHFEGIILGQTSINFGNATSIDGRLLAQTAVNLDNTTVTQP
ncbi:MAG: ice-binding family protein [Pseudomonadota bacterium]